MNAIPAMRTLRPVLFLATCLLALALAGCGGSNSDPDDGIGAAGGTVTAADGASVVVPAGALTQATDIGIAAGNDGAPALPAGTTTLSAIYALTPHGTTFAAPVTVTIPFDPALLPAGASVGLLKTNAGRTAWEPVAGATVSGNLVSGQVSGFSDLVAVVLSTPGGFLTGTWTSIYICETTEGSTFSGEDTIVITQTGAGVAFTGSDGATGTGSIVDVTVTWSAVGPGYTETGTWTILDEDSMVKQSTYTNSPSIGGGGTCSGSIHKQP